MLRHQKCVHPSILSGSSMAESDTACVISQESTESFKIQASQFSNQSEEMNIILSLYCDENDVHINDSNEVTFKERKCRLCEKHFKKPKHAVNHLIVNHMPNNLVHYSEEIDVYSCQICFCQSNDKQFIYLHILMQHSTVIINVSNGILDDMASSDYIFSKGFSTSKYCNTCQLTFSTLHKKILHSCTVYSKKRKSKLNTSILFNDSCSKNQLLRNSHSIDEISTTPPNTISTMPTKLKLDNGSKDCLYNVFIKNINILSDSKKQVRKKKKNLFICPYCKNQYVSKNGLEIHLNHCYSDSFKCNYCKAKFVTKNRLDIHFENGCKKNTNNNVEILPDRFNNDEHYLLGQEIRDFDEQNSEKEAFNQDLKIIIFTDESVKPANVDCTFGNDSNFFADIKLPSEIQPVKKILLKKLLRDKRPMTSENGDENISKISDPDCSVLEINSNLPDKNFGSLFKNKSSNDYLNDEIDQIYLDKGIYSSYNDDYKLFDNSDKCLSNISLTTDLNKEETCVEVTNFHDDQEKSLNIKRKSDNKLCSINYDLEKVMHSSNVRRKKRFKRSCFLKNFTKKRYSRVAHKLKIFKCKLCNFRSVTLIGVRCHFGVKHKGLPFSYFIDTKTKDGMATNNADISETYQIYKCSICPYKIDKMLHYSDHMKYHNFKGSHICPFCVFSTNSSHYLNQHKILHTKPNKNKIVRETLKCHICPFESRGKIAFNHHMDMHNYNNFFKCIICTFSTDKQFILKRHIQLHQYYNNIYESSKKYKCDICPFVSNYPMPLKLHKMHHNDFELHKCSECNYSENDFQSLFKHTLLHQSNYNHFFKRHLSNHNSPSKYKCNKCFYSTNFLKNLDYHKKLHKNKSILDLELNCDQKVKAKILFCEKCPFKAKYASSLKQHMCFHNYNRKYKCVICKFSTSFMPTFCRHKLLHNINFSKKNDIINGTGSITLTNDKVSTEIMTRVNKDLKCNKCPFSTVSKSCMNRHIKFHMSKQWYKCKFCDFSTVSNVTLRRHSLLHKKNSCDNFKEKMKQTYYFCSKCPYVTVVKQYLNHHLKKHNYKEKYKCNSCIFSSNSVSTYIRHKKSHLLNRKYTNLHYFEENIRLSNRDVDNNCTNILNNSDLDINKKVINLEKENMTSLNLEIKKNNIRYRFLCKLCSYQSHFSKNIKIHLRNSHKNIFNISDELINLNKYITKFSFRLKCNFCSYTTKSFNYIQLHVNRKHNILLNVEKKTSHVKILKYSSNANNSNNTSIIKNLNDNFTKTNTSHSSKYICDANKSNDFESTSVNNFKSSNNKPVHSEKDFDMESLSHSNLNCSNVCGINSSSIEIGSNLKECMKKNLVNNLYKCEVCSYTSSTFLQLNIHKRKHQRSKFNRDMRQSDTFQLSNGKLFNCSECPYSANIQQESKISIHKSRHEVSSAFKCSDCSYSSSSNQQIVSHYRLHKRKKFMKSINSDISKEDFHLPLPASKNIPMIPVKMEIPLVKFRCEFCPYGTDIDKHYEQHVSLHNLDLMTVHRHFACRFCDYACPSYIFLLRHEVLHSKPNPNLLALNGEFANITPMMTVNNITEFTKLSNYLFEHLNSFQTMIKQSFKCEYCPKVSSTKQSHIAHIKSHKINGDHKCAFCSYSASSAQAVEEHVEVHFNLPDNALNRIGLDEPGAINFKNNILKGVISSINSKKFTLINSLHDLPSTKNNFKECDNEDYLTKSNLASKKQIDNNNGLLHFKTNSSKSQNHNIYSVKKNKFNFSVNNNNFNQDINDSDVSRDLNSVISINKISTTTKETNYNFSYINTSRFELDKNSTNNMNALNLKRNESISNDIKLDLNASNYQLITNSIDLKKQENLTNIYTKKKKNLNELSANLYNNINSSKDVNFCNSNMDNSLRHINLDASNYSQIHTFNNWNNTSDTKYAFKNIKSTVKLANHQPKLLNEISDHHDAISIGESNLIIFPHAIPGNAL